MWCFHYLDFPFFLLFLVFQLSPGALKGEEANVWISRAETDVFVNDDGSLKVGWRMIVSKGLTTVSVQLAVQLLIVGDGLDFRVSLTK